MKFFFGFRQICNNHTSDHEQEASFFVEDHGGGCIIAIVVHVRPLISGVAVQLDTFLTLVSYLSSLGVV